MLVTCSNRGIGFGSSNPEQTSKLLLEDRLSEQVTELATEPFNTGDLECDPGSFSALGKTVVWGISLDGKVFAIEVPADLRRGRSGSGRSPEPSRPEWPSDARADGCMQHAARRR